MTDFFPHVFKGHRYSIRDSPLRDHVICLMTWASELSE